MKESSALAPVLVCDDSDDDAAQLRRVLTKSKLTNPVLTVSTGHAGIALLKKLAVHDLPAVVFTDLRMPDGDGFAVIEFVRSEPALRDVPVIVVSGTLRESEIRRAFSLGSSACYPKHPSPHVVRDLVQVAPRLSFSEQ